MDIVQENNPLEEKALEIFAKDSPQAQKLGFYLDPVPHGLPPIPHGFRNRSEDIPGSWKVICPKLLEIHDQAATKLKSFRPQDKQDLRYVCDQGQIDPEKLRSSLEAAFPWYLPKDGDADRDLALQNLDTVQQYIRGEISEL